MTGTRLGYALTLTLSQGERGPDQVPLPLGGRLTL
jgi:hypothetical protein